MGKNKETESWGEWAGLELWLQTANSMFFPVVLP